jgi:phosphatidylinositol 3-kinase
VRKKRYEKMQAFGKAKEAKEAKERIDKQTDNLKTLVRFIKNISRESTEDDEQDKFRRLSKWYIKEYYRKNGNNMSSPLEISQMHDNVLLHTLSLWQDVHSLCPLIHEFNLSSLQLATDDIVYLLLPQLLMSLRTSKDKQSLENVILRCTKNISSTCKLFWILVVELERENIFKSAINDCFFSKLIYSFMKKLATIQQNENNKNYHQQNTYRLILKQQGELIEKLVRISGTIRQSRVSIQEKKSLLKKILLQPQQETLLFNPVSFPLFPETHVIGLVPEECSVFQSQLNPLLLTFLTKDGKMIKCIFKSGDDLRQDAIIVQILNVMKQLLNNNGMNVENIITYRILSTGLEHGFVEYVPSSDCLDNIFRKENGIGGILQDSNGLLNERKMKKFIESTAYYTVMTYILCIGDRHLDNIMLTNDGKLFHIDYGFVGREPKPFAPAVKLCPEIIDIMGGKYSGYYATFIRKCIATFLIMRKNSHVFIDMLDLMIDGGINDITAVTIEKIRKRFLLHMTDKDSITTLTNEIERGFETILPKMMDNFHHTWKVVQSGNILNKKKEEDEDGEWLYV